MWWPFSAPPPPPPPLSLVEELSQVHSLLTSGFYPYVFVGLSLLNLAFKLFLALRSRRRLQQSTGVPEDVRRVFGPVDDGEYETTRQYSLAKNALGLVSLHFGLVTTGLGLYWMPLVWNGPAKVMAAYLGYGPDCEIVRMLLSTLILGPIESLLSLPLGAYGQLVLEERFGFNNQTAGGWLLDALKSMVVEMLISAVSMAPLVWTLRSLGPHAWLYGWLFLSVFVIVFNMAYPILIMPLFNKFSPMETGPVRDSIERLVAKTKLSSYTILVSDGSRQSSHSNAFVTGFFGVKRIVIYDTLLTDLGNSVPDVTAVLAHEVGHAKLGHNYISLVLVLLNLFMTFFTYGYMQSEGRSLAAQFGYALPADPSSEEQGVPGSVFLTLNLFFMVFSAIVSPPFELMMNVVTRQLEFAADRFSAEQGYDIRPSLLKLARKNKENADPDPFVSICTHSHPVTTQRVRAVDECLKKKH